MSSGASSSGVGFGGLLFIVFLVLKLTEVIDWSWWWVTAPLWLPVLFAAHFFAFCAVMAVLTGQTKRRRR